MRSWKFPNMLESNTANIWASDKYLEQTKQNSIILLNCEQNELFCDPDFGIKLKRYLFEQNSSVLRDILADEIYTKLAIFIPQVRLSRRDIKIKKASEKGKVIIQFSGINQIDYQHNMYQINILLND